MDQTIGYSKSPLSPTNSTQNVTARKGTDNTIEEIRQNIEQTRNEITDTVDQIGERLKQTIDWRSYISEYPLVAFGGATLLGFYLTRKLLAPKRSTTEQLLQSLLINARNVIAPKRSGMALTLLTMAGKYALDQYQQYQKEQAEQSQIEEQLQTLQMHQQMLMQENNYQQPTVQRRVAGGEL